MSRWSGPGASGLRPHVAVGAAPGVFPRARPPWGHPPGNGCGRRDTDFYGNIILIMLPYNCNNGNIILIMLPLGLRRPVFRRAFLEGVPTGRSGLAGASRGGRAARAARRVSRCVLLAGD